MQPRDCHRLREVEVSNGNDGGKAEGLCLRRELDENSTVAVDNGSSGVAAGRMRTRALLAVDVLRLQIQLDTRPTLTTSHGPASGSLANTSFADLLVKSFAGDVSSLSLVVITHRANSKIPQISP